MTLSALDFVLASRRSEITGLQQLLQMGKLVGAVSQLIHLLQRERVTDNLFLCSQANTCGGLLRVRVEFEDRVAPALLQQLETLVLLVPPRYYGPRPSTPITTVTSS